ncbi:hypothetical protein BGX27_005344 [Mortierella sp. AM989]|nr:hypothetical protein BGX27_005344 [Mortierella sp. AM989]
MNPYSTPPSSSASLDSSSPSSLSLSSQNQLRQDRTDGNHHVPSFAGIARQDGSSPDVAELASSYMPSPANYHDINHINHDPISNSNSNSDSGSSSRNSRPVTSSSSQQFHHHVDPHEVHNQGNSQSHYHSHNYSHRHGQSFDTSPHAHDEDEGLDEEEDHQSDEGSEGEPGFNEMEYWLQRCSICFDARLDFCLELCRDQFCRDCFQRYVKEVVSNSWGLNVTKIKCPVCQDTIAQSEWTKYVDQSTLAQYSQYNQPYRSFSRFCGECEHELVISQIDRSAIGLPVRELQPLFENLLKELKSLLILAGLNLGDFSAVSHTKSKLRLYLSSQDEVACEIVQRFTDDYKSFCGTSQGPQLSLPSKAQSYLSNLAYRTLGGPFILPIPSTSTSASSVQSGDSLSSLSQVHHHSIPSSSSTPGVHVSQPKAIPQSTSESTHQHSSHLFQRRQHPKKVNGVLEIYKSLMIPLLGLLDLQSKDERNERVTSHSESLKAKGYKDDDIPSGEEEGTSSRHTIESLGSVVDPKHETNDTITSSVKRKGTSAQIPQNSKRTRLARTGITTRAEKRRKEEVKRTLAIFSKHLSSIETRPEQWKELQFLHVRWLRWEWCNNCNQELCLQCGESSHHESQDCFEYMRSLIAGNSRTLNTQKKRSIKTTSLESPSTDSFAQPLQTGKDRSDLDTNTIHWKLANTNPCPNCCILIHRDDGCNKVDCMLCGYRFCWVCREAWGSACGFFNCGRKPSIVQSLALESPINSEEGLGDEHLANVQRFASGDEQIHSLAVSQGLLTEALHAQVGTTLLQQDLQGHPSLDPSTASEKVFYEY